MGSGGEPQEPGATLIWKQGFPTATDFSEACDTALSTARGQGVTDPLMHPGTKIETPAHIDAGEYLVRLVFGNAPEE
jgi:hypothetical protein